MRHRVSFITTIFTFIVLFLGNLVVATEAGDACGSDWPYCNGSLIPDFTDPLVVIEYSHRLFTGGLGFLILINFFVAWRKKRPGEKSVKVLAPLSVLLLFTQAFTGGLNVLLNTPPGFTTLDVSISLALLVSLVLLTVALKRKPVEKMEEADIDQQKKLKRLYIPSLFAISFLYFQIVLGAFFKHSGASEIVMGIQRSERLFHSIPLSQFLYFIHGIVSLGVAVAVAWVFFHALQKKVLVRSSLILVILVVFETIVGFMTVVTKIAVYSSSIHMIIATITLTVGAYIVGKAGFGEYFVIKEKNDHSDSSC
ncbi:COX15/CtaA family protein [Microaerobacter geothermalis]|uniref:COX15/CtaA family protein n=1 Tax=Microaerobacter geothermalis TaxID=674972 RepID=UPI001F3CAB17|nr:COX15/CtaA family protein [Microaerobacter geothermalis]MCF6093643.1 COX15/CtaA family protein [Microaerobacter geothermalis]